jgi:hypothetical protein
MQQTLQCEVQLLPSFVEIRSAALPTLGANIPVTCMQRIIMRDAGGASSISGFQVPVQARMLYAQFILQPNTSRAVHWTDMSLRYTQNL